MENRQQALALRLEPLNHATLPGRHEVVRQGGVFVYDQHATDWGLLARTNSITGLRPMTL